jgi:hypothetical protein
MPAKVSEVATALKTRLATISGLRTFNYQPEQLNPPVAYPVLNQVDYHRAFKGGNVVMQWAIHVVVGRYTDSRAHLALDDFLSYDGAKSIRGAFESDPTLGGVVQSLVLSSGANVTSISEDGAEFLEVQMTLTVHA